MNPEAHEFREELNILIAFIEGRVDGNAFESALHTDRMKALLSIFENPRYPATTNYYSLLTNGRDRSSLSGLVNSEGIVEQFLKAADAVYKPVSPSTALYKLILSTLPEYVDPPLRFLLEHVVPSDQTISKAEKKKRIRQRIAELFRFAKRPPKWIQSAEWPINDDKPAFFINQIEINAPELFHDNGVAYLFFHTGIREFETVTQFY